MDVYGPQDVESTTVTSLTGNGRTTDVMWDKYSLVIKGQRVFIHSGEFHTFRLPVPGLWLDILQKIKAAGFNAISVYTHMALINPSPGVIDFNDYRALEPLYEAAKQTGIWVVLRPDYCWRIAHWATSEVAGELRTNATDWEAAWQDYIQGVVTETVQYQVSQGGPVIDNEYSQSPVTHAEYFAALETVYHNSSIVVPLTANDPGEESNWLNGTGAVDVYGLDSYPQRFDCSNPTVWNPVVTTYHSYHESTFQGGAFDAWGPTAPGYDKCRALTGTDFENVFYLDLWASNAKLINYYMLYGGTSWASYDYGSAIAENRELTAKYAELKREGLFLRSSPEFYKTDHIGNSTDGAVTVTNASAFVTLLTNPDTSTSFYIARQNDSTLTTNFKLNVTTSGGSFQIPRIASAITLSGRQSKVIVTDYSFGSSKILYSTAQIGGRDVLFLYGDHSQEHEAALALTGTPRFQAQSAKGLVTIWDSSEQLILYSDTATAGTFWSPEIPSSESGDFANYWQFGTNMSILVGGPYLGLFSAQISPSVLASGIVAPPLTGWKYADSLPEVQASFSDADWTIANHTTTNIPFKPHYGDGRVLYGCDYEFCENTVLWRGHFNATEDTKSVNLSINGGEAFAASVWVNNVFLNTSYGNSTNNRNILEETDDKFYFPIGSLLYNQDNVITILQASQITVIDEEKSPRGVRGFMLNTGDFGEWKVQGKVGGYTKVRGVLNEGGLYGERMGWHLPGYDTSSWVSRDISEGLPNAAAGVGFFVTTFDLNIPEGYDIPISFNFDQWSQPYRAQLYVNGWMMGKRVANLGPQYKFPVHEGILNYNGAMALWAMEPITVSPTLQLTVDNVYEGGVGGIEVNNPGWSAEGRDRATPSTSTRM
ncbi:glycoside hydrolase family 35 protein [Melanogaster broomeanus]|nr:glycoside hydrolase family 35 protein [Melanogaster broomeanus]